MDTNTKSSSGEGSSGVNTRLYPCTYCGRQVTNPCIHQSQADRCGKSFKIIRLWKPLLNYLSSIKQYFNALFAAVRRSFA